MKRLIYSAMSIAILFAVSCKKEKTLSSSGRTLFGTEKPYISVPGAVRDTLVGEITVNSTVTEDTYLQGIVYVKPGVTLTVNPGVTIYGSQGPGVFDPANLANNKGVLVVEKGGKLIANGTPTQPIVWTSNNPVGQRSFADWGGIVMMGNAPIAASVNGVCSSSNTFEGFNVPSWPNPARNVYGGTDPNDNSGSIQYNRIEFCGGGIAAANREVNGLTLCGVGKGTTILAVEVSASGDDGFEFFGGNVDARALISYNNKDDDFDFDEGYNGRIQFAIAYRTTLADNSGSHFIESDNTPTATLLCPGFRTRPFMSNVSFLSLVPGAPTGGAGSFFDSASVLIRRNSAFVLANAIVDQAAQFDRFVATTPTTTPLVASGTSLSTDSIYIGVNSVKNVLSGIASSENGLPFTGTLTLPLQGPSVNPITNIFTLPGGINVNPIDPFFISTTEQGAIPTGLNWIAGTWISTDLN
jgi:hypothetical protein